jgi:ABC-2 type transport system ATP-binding protein
MNAIEAAGLGKRYRGNWALRECTLAIPAGQVTALVGPNGAGKSTLLNIAAGLSAPSAGNVTVLGGARPGSAAALDGIAFVAQGTPLYGNLSPADLLHLTRNLSRRFDQRYADTRLADLGIPLDRKAGKLSGGQQAQLSLTLALARRPRLLVLDEPTAMLDPVARRDFMAAVMSATARDGMSVLLSSHVLAELEQVAGYLVLLSAGRVRLAGEVAGLLAGHRLLTGPAEEAGPGAQPDRLVVPGAAGDPVPPGWQAYRVSLEELALAYLREPSTASAHCQTAPSPAVTP